MFFQITLRNDGFLKEPLIKSGFNQLDAKKWEDHFLEVTKNARFTGEINSPYAHFLGLLQSKSPQEALNQCFLQIVDKVSNLPEEGIGAALPCR